MSVIRLDNAADEMAIVDERGQVVGVMNKKHMRHRYFEEIEAS